MKKIFTLIAVALMGISSVSAQTMTLKIEGQEVKNGDVVVISKLPKGTAVGPMTLYDLGVEVEFKSLIAQTVQTEGIDLDQMTPGLACCPTGFSCTVATADNGWKSVGTMDNLTAGQEVNGEWIHYNYQRTKPEDGIARKSKITFKGASETIAFDLTINATDPSGIDEVIMGMDDNAPAYNIAGQKVNAGAKGVVIKAGKKFIVK